MRRVLVDHARAKRREKRGGEALKVTLNDNLHAKPGTTNEVSILELDDALSKLAEIDEPMAKAVELIFFGGLSYDDAATALGVARSTLFEKMRYAKAWLKTAMQA